MCGIVGLYLKDATLEDRFGALLGGMLGMLSDRGPDSAGFAVYGAGRPGRVKLSLRGPAGCDFDALARSVGAAAGGSADIRRHGTHAVMTVDESAAAAIEARIAAGIPDVSVVGKGRRMEVFKEIGRPETVASSFGLDRMVGTHGIGHTRMATESAVTTDGAHPYSTGPDQCLVHNGSLSNHNAVRRELAHDGVRFATENDTEVAAGYLTSRMRRGDSLGGALSNALRDLDGFYTFVVGTESGFGVLRDGIACKPAVMVETDRYVAFGSEYRALADLPGVESGRVWEPEPAKPYFWERAA